MARSTFRLQLEQRTLLGQLNRHWTEVNAVSLCSLLTFQFPTNTRMESGFDSWLGNLYATSAIWPNRIVLVQLDVITERNILDKISFFRALTPNTC